MVLFGDLMRNLLLLSSSKTPQSKFLIYAREQIKEHFADVKTVTFIPYASDDHDGYTQLVADFFSTLNIKVNSVHQFDDPATAVASAEGIFIGGGNTFRLLTRLYENSLIAPIRAAVLNQGIPYMGASAGSNLACPTTKTTNDMPILQPPSFAALNLVPFQINPHFLDADPTSTHQGETREDRLNEFLEENDCLVAGLREGAWLDIQQDRCTLGGSGAGMVVFSRQQTRKDFQSGNVDFLLKPMPAD